MDRLSRPGRIVAQHPRVTVLTVLGLLYLARAWQIAADEAIVDPADAILHETMPIWLRGALWAVCGTAVLVAACRPRWHPIGFGVAVVMPLERVIGYGWSALAYLLPGAPPGKLSSLPWCLWWASFAALIVALSRWPEPQPHPRKGD